MSEVFDAAQLWVDNKLVERMKGYAREWYNSPAGKKYHEDWHFAKSVVFYYSTLRI